MLFEPYVRFHIFVVRVTESPPIAIGQYDMFSKYMYLIVIFSHLNFSSGTFFLISPFPDHCLLIPI